MHIVADAGHTQVAAGSRTVLALGPGRLHLDHLPVLAAGSTHSRVLAPAADIDSVTGHLKLY